MSAADELAKALGNKKFGTVLADPPWRFANRTGKMAPEHRRLGRYETLSFEEITALPIADFLDERAHCYLRMMSIRSLGHQQPSWVNCFTGWMLDVMADAPF